MIHAIEKGSDISKKIISQQQEEAELRMKSIYIILGLTMCSNSLDQALLGNLEARIPPFFGRDGFRGKVNILINCKHDDR